ncbi:hypothetical protein PV379_28880 [Streptomyces caniscabiei]|uniref:hypothetical protein n=1 Tax=Streptomyces caniscabiei TaxID=2746961 RepID=UPI0029B71706|nr:hypothetical protein [Streptomyces caniscabiei]MDX2604803.1 hypothetical protein [Streptomyces caniscabiei]MDX2741315.1 hypothetical protein [Streptomyces caniscabiei]MDX2781286.1 hypothetical protein [Streptomyces caniscabiei]
MPADEVTHGTSVGESRARSGPRHAAPKKPLLTRLNMPAGKAIALAAMPTAVLMGMGFTPTLTLARADDPTKLSLTADEYKDCVEALEAAEEGTDASATPTPTPSAEESTDSTDEGKDEGEDTSAGDDPADDSNSSGDSAADDTTTDDSASSDSGSDDKDSSTSDESKTDDTDKSATDTAGSGEAPSADTSGTDGGGNVLEDIGTAIEDLFTPDDKETETTPSTSTSPSPSPSPSDDASGSDEGKDDAGSDAGKDAKDTAGNASDKVEDAAKDVTDTAGDTEDTEDAEKAAEDATDDATDDATATPSPSPSESADTEGCPVATDDESGVEKGIPPLPNDPWYLNASSLLLKGADYKGVVKVKTADGSVKEVLKYVISDGTDIGDLHQTVEDKQAGVTYHVQAGKGTTSTIREGRTVMYTESISGNLLGLIPVTFDPKHPPPLNIPLIYFTKVKVVQAGQFGGTLTVPGMHQFMTD